MEDKLREILQYYEEVYGIPDSSIEDVYNELIDNNVEVQGNSFYCEVIEKTTGYLVLLAGTKDKADMWVLKKIIKLIKTGKPFITFLNGNSEYILQLSSKYNLTIFKRENDMSYIAFNWEDN